MNCRCNRIHKATCSRTSVLSHSLLEDVNLFLWPYTRVLFVGATRQAQDTLKDDALRNTVHALFLALDEGTTSREGGGALGEVGGKVRRWMAREEREEEGGVKEKGVEKEREGAVGRVRVKSRLVKCYLRCLFCNGGEVGVRLLDEWSKDGGFLKKEDLFPGMRTTLPLPLPFFSRFLNVILSLSLSVMHFIYIKDTHPKCSLSCSKCRTNSRPSTTFQTSFAT